MIKEFSGSCSCFGDGQGSLGAMSTPLISFRIYQAPSQPQLFPGLLLFLERSQGQNFIHGLRAEHSTFTATVTVPSVFLCFFLCVCVLHQTFTL